jgi:butyrate kinase
MRDKDSLIIMCINPGSTSTKVALFEGEREVFSENVTHDAENLTKFKEPTDQKDYRKDTIIGILTEKGVDLSNVNAFVGIGGGLERTVSGVYSINDLMFEHAKIPYNGVRHPAILGVVLARMFADEYGKRAFVVNPNDIDELQHLARVTGIKGIYRVSRGHPLNQKEIAFRYAKQVGKKYEEMNIIVAHIGGGVSVGAHRKGKLIDMNDVVNGDGPMAPTRCGAIPVTEIIDLCYGGTIEEKEIRNYTTKTGGLVDHLGTSDAREIVHRIENGDAYAKLIFDAMIYQIAKQIGAMAAELKGNVDGIVLTGGISHSEYLISEMKSYIDWIADVAVMPGEHEMEAMAAGAIRALTGEEETLEYTGVPPWNGFADVKRS